MVREGYLVGIFMVPHSGVLLFKLEYWGSSMRVLDVGFLLELVYGLCCVDCDCSIRSMFRGQKT